MIGKTILHYKILEEIGRGGMGVVYKAEDTKLKRTVALKFLPLELTRDPEAKERFIREAQAASSLDHPNICTIYEINETEDGQLYIVMAYYEGETLKEKLVATPPFSPLTKGEIKGGLAISQTIDIAIQIAQGLARAHEEGIIHRDIKPANIIITGRGEVKILDFGLAKLAGQAQLTKDTSTLGTVAYMSPEQLSGKEVDQRTDIWSLGMLLYEMLTSELPFKGEYEQAVTYAILNEEVKLPSSVRKEIPAYLDHVITKALERDPTERYHNMNELLEELKKPIVVEKLEEWKKSIAILPFENMSADSEQEYFCDGMTEEIINVLSQLKNLKVIARTSAFEFKGKREDVREIGRKLGVDHLLEGSVRKAGTRIRITAQLIKVADGSHLWSEHYDRELGDVFVIQDEIAREVTNNLELQLLKEEKFSISKHTTENFSAYDLYMKGLYCLNKNTDEWVRKSITYFEKAIQEDVNYPVAYAALAESYLHLYGGIGVIATKDNIRKAREAAQKALIMDPELAEVHVAMGMIALYYDWDRTQIKNCLKKAIKLNPNYVKSYIWYATYFIYFEKDYVQALDMIKTALELDPLDLLLKVVELNIYTWQKKFTKALDYCQSLINLEPNYAMGHYFLGMIQGGMGLFDKAIRKMLESIELGGRSIHHIGMLGYFYARAGQETKARKLLDEIIQRMEQGSASSSWVARVYAGLGKTDKVFEYLEKAYEERDISLIYINCEYEFDEVRSDSRFQELLKRIGLLA